MKKAYIIVAHKNPKQLYRLISRLSDGNSEFFVHIGLNSSISSFYEILDIGQHIHFLPRFNSAWGGYGTIEPYLSGMKAVRDSPIEFDRILLLSGQDYPIKSNKEIDEFFQSSEHTVFLDYYPIPNHAKWPGKDRGGLYRIDKYYYGMAWHQMLRSKTMNVLSSFIPALKRKLPNNMKPYTGNTWFNLDMYSLNYILNYHEAHPEYFEFHKHTYVADELFIHMIVGNSTDEKLLNSIANTEKRFTIWDDPTFAHPRILTKNDFPEISKSDDLFARKFEESDSEILDRIDQEILFK